jgi:Repeat in HS1/Cortactin
MNSLLFISFFILFVSCACIALQVFCSLDYKTGFGGKFGVQTDRMDKSSLGWDHHEQVEKHVSQKGTSTEI